MPRGGARKGAGRPKGQGRYGESTQPLRVPESLLPDVRDFIEARGYRLPLYSSRVAAGSPVAADEDIEERLDLNAELIAHPAATFLLRVSGDSMIKVGIHEGDMLVVDQSLQPAHGKIVIAALDGELTVKRLHRRDGEIRLMPENDNYAPIPVASESELHIWGVVTSVIHSF